MTYFPPPTVNECSLTCDLMAYFWRKQEVEVCSFDGKMTGLATELRELIEGSRSKTKHHLKLLKWLQKHKLLKIKGNATFANTK